MAVKLEELNEQNWDVLILDESQAIKNAGTKQSKAIKAIPATMKIAMTGTPIENHLGDLWSLFDFLNKGLLGSAKEFTTFTKQLTEETGGYGKLRKTVSPFILRRLKTDKTIIADLPDKIEMKEYAALTKRQIGLYQELLKEITLKLKEAEGIQRKGVVLSSIMKFKQICNHPAQYLGQEEFKPQYSGKFQQLAEICETIYEKHERVLVFTQFKEMTQPLSEFLQELFHKEGFVLHGGTPIKNRQEMVEKFNGEAYVPYMVLSLKAGGVGLNLTGANHVVHFDRWWNPAVENQATDRAFRIGQTKNVMVHKFVTKGTIEEKIDAMMEEKQKLAGDILASSGEKWITELDNKELLNLFQLGGV
ncbi:MAG: DEAD/DEAH box helicase, partial [Anaerovorax sp.]